MKNIIVQKGQNVTNQIIDRAMRDDKAQHVHLGQNL